MRITIVSVVPEGPPPVIRKMIVNCLKEKIAARTTSSSSVEPIPGKSYVPEELQPVGAVDAGGLIEFLGDRLQGCEDDEAIKGKGLPG